MQRLLLGLIVLTALAPVAGCGPATGIESGIPSDANQVPVNPTPDMGPDPKAKAK
ncbi:hypothetical protein TA3x_000837 [Tundrisphaera sp. TA3]|uniref:hypothetical protein n=1 Tax=Tundrisphaera sp. TA3 TaxID=3435775 RepID=UPI003EBE2440